MEVYLRITCEGIPDNTDNRDRVKETVDKVLNLPVNKHDYQVEEVQVAPMNVVV